MNGATAAPAGEFGDVAFSLSAGYQNGAPGTPTYNWVITSPTGGTWSLQSPASSVNQVVNCHGVCDGETEQTLVHCDVTDAQGNVSHSPSTTLQAYFQALQPI